MQTHRGGGQASQEYDPAEQAQEQKPSQNKVPHSKASRVHVARDEQKYHCNGVLERQSWTPATCSTSKIIWKMKQTFTWRHSTIVLIADQVMTLIAADCWSQ